MIGRSLRQRHRHDDRGERIADTHAYTSHQWRILISMKRIQIYIEDSIDEVLTRQARKDRRSKAALIRDAVRAAYEPASPHPVDPFDRWAGGIDEASGDIDELVYGR